MSINPIYCVLNYIMLAANIFTAFFCFGIRQNALKPTAIGFVSIFLFNIVVYLIPFTAPLFERAPVALLWFILLLYANPGRLFSKLFIYFGAFYVTLFLFVGASFIAEAFFPYESRGYYYVLFLCAAGFFITFAFLARLYGKAICDRLFIDTKPAEWAVYMVVPVASLAVIGYGYLAQGIYWHPLPVQRSVHYLVLPLLMLACHIFIVLAILNTREKTKERLGADFSRDIVVSSQAHYQKMDMMYAKVRMQQLDHQQKLSTARNMLLIGDVAGAVQYLTDVEQQLAELPRQNYCSNEILNELLVNYAERCDRQNIGFWVDLKGFESIHASNYDLCIIFGNLLENAIEACAKVNFCPTIDVSLRQNSTHSSIIIKNSFNGYIRQKEGLLMSTKPAGGLGLRSVKTVANRHGGDLSLEWSENIFIAAVTLRQ